MFGHSWRLGRIAGIEVRVDSSWAVIAFLIGYSFYLQFSMTYPRESLAADAGLAALATLLFFGSVLTHELAHSLMSRARGIRVQDITLFLFGGATRARVESKGPTDEFIVTVVGPLTSLVLAGVFFLVAVLGRGVLSRPVAGAFAYLASVNLVLAAFNLLPGFPLDGGRVLRSVVWKVTGNLRKATRVAATAGQAFGWLLVAVGVVFVLAGALQGLWLAAVGWFLMQSARASYMDVQIRGVLERADAEDVMARDLVRIPADVTIGQAVRDYFMRYDHSAFPVEREGRTIGLLTLRAVRRVPQEEWEHRRVSDVMEPLRDEITVAPDTPMDRVMNALTDDGAGRALVVRDGEVVGIITPQDVARWLQWSQALDGERVVPVGRTGDRTSSPTTPSSA
ncbi:MAG: site-2 protease family protein [Actinomycetota bacterium]